MDNQNNVQENVFDFSAAHAKTIAAIDEIEKVLVGKRSDIIMLFTALLSGSHVLIEDVPGTGKTTLAATIAKVTGLDFNRAQFTPDVMASDITGFNIYNRQKEQFEFREGLVMCNLLLADEINRASPKTQSALLEAMEENKVTVDGVTYATPDPFMVIATQNPSGYVGYCVNQNKDIRDLTAQDRSHANNKPSSRLGHLMGQYQMTVIVHIPYHSRYPPNTPRRLQHQRRHYRSHQQCT